MLTLLCTVWSSVAGVVDDMFNVRPCESRAWTSEVSRVMVLPSASVCTCVILDSAVYGSHVACLFVAGAAALVPAPLSLVSAIWPAADKAKPATAANVNIP
jgi:hypothetical protein